MKQDILEIDYLRKISIRIFPLKVEKEKKNPSPNQF